MPDYLPSTDLGLLAWGDNFASLITADPPTYGLVAGDATAIQNAFDAYETALQTALDPPTRTPVSLPDGTGHDLMRRLRDRHAVRGIAISGFGSKEDLRRSQEAGFSEHIIKPVRLNQLRAAIKRLIALG